MQRLPLCLRALLLALATATTLLAQQAVINRAEQGAPTNPATPALRPKTTDQAADEDAGVQRVADPRRLPFKVTATLDEQLYATSNVFLEPSGSGSPEDAVILATTGILRIDGLARSVGSTVLIPSASFIWQRYLHGIATTDGTIEELDFDSYSLPLALAVRFGQGWEATATFNSSAIYSVRGAPDYELLFRSYTPSLALRKIIELAETRFLIASASTAYSNTWTSATGVEDNRNDRADLTLDVAYMHLLGRWTLNPFARANFSHYIHWQEAVNQDYDRDDLTLSSGLSVSYAFNDWSSLRVFASYDLRFSDSDSSVDYTYHSGSAGLGATLSLRY